MENVVRLVARRTPAKHEPGELAIHKKLGHDLIPLCRWDLVTKGDDRGKTPQELDWRTRNYAGFDAEAHMLAGCNVGVRLRATDLAVDVDPRHFAEGDNPLQRLCADTGLDLARCPTVNTGGGGSHFYLRKAADIDVATKLVGYPGIELKTMGTQVVAAGSLHPTTGQRYLWDPLSADAVPEAPPALLRLAERKAVVSSTTEAGGEHTPEQVAGMLAQLEPQRFKSYGAFIELMMSVHHATGGSARQQFLDWAARDPEYATAKHRHSNAAKWDALKPGGNGRAVTHRTLHKLLRDAGKADAIPQRRVEGDFEPVTQADFPDIEVPPALRGVADQWVYVADPHAFVRRSDGKKYAPEQWKALHAPAWPDGDVLSAVWKSKMPVRKFEELVYVPCQGEMPDGDDGRRYNLWKPSGVEPKEGDVGPFVDHAQYLLPDQAERDLLLDYLAFLVQRPAEKIMFAALVHGRQGTGKSWVGEVMARIIGEPNVIRPSNDEVISRWTAWMEGAQLALIEELMTLGRLEVMNRLKPVITQPKIRIEDKRCKLYSIPNHLNLLCFTNHENALKLEGGDRRWMVLSSPADPREEAYYARLFQYLAGDGPAAVKHWLLQRKSTINPKGRAPKTRAKEEMRRSAMGDLESHLLALLEERQPPFDFDLVRFEDVVGAVPRNVRSNETRSRVTTFLKNEAGAVRHSRYTNTDRPAWTLWSIDNHAKWAAAGAAGRIDAFTRHLQDSSKASRHVL